MAETITRVELAARWGMHYGSLSNWRVQGRGPQCHRDGRTVFYRIADVLDYERDHPELLNP